MTAIQSAPGALALLGPALLHAGCATGSAPEKPVEFNCPTGKITCIQQAQQKCPEHRILVFDSYPSLTEVSELAPDAPISEATIMKRPVTIICEKPAS
jgi:hypothetical protein